MAKKPKSVMVESLKRAAAPRYSPAPSFDDITILETADGTTRVEVRFEH